MELLLYLGLAYLIGFPLWVIYCLIKDAGQRHRGYDDTTKSCIEDWM